MSQKGKQWLASKANPFSISSSEGGNVGSLISLGFVKKEIKQTPAGPKGTGRYIITASGKEWIENQRKRNG